jgi:small subunit ribosomal protein S6
LKTVAARLYEGMFLVDSALAASDWQGINDTIRTILERAGAEIVSIDKWDERKLAYDIKGKSRGTYILTYFRVDGTKVAQIERAAQISEDIMRLLILGVEDIGEQYVTKKATVAAEKSERGHAARWTPDTQQTDDIELEQSTGRLTAEPEDKETDRMDIDQEDLSDEEVQEEQK